MTLMDAIKRAHAAKTRGGPDVRTGLVLAAVLPSAEELGDTARRVDPSLSPGEALEFGFQAREAALEVMEDLLTDEDA